MIDPTISLDQRANLTPEDLRDYYLEMGHRELAVIKERDEARRQLAAALERIAVLEAALSVWRP